MAEPKRRILGFNRNVFFLGLTSFFQDVSGEMIFTIMPLFLANLLGATTSVIGLVTGIADSTASLLKLAGGWLADRVGRHKALTAAGYGLSTLVKPLLYFASTWGMVLAVRVGDRVGKGVRTSPRDALIAESTDATEYGRSFGFHRAMDSLGAVVGLGGAALVVFLVQGGAVDLSRPTYRTLVLLGVVPGVVGVLLLLLFVRDIGRLAHRREAHDLAAQGGTAAGNGLDGRFKVFLAVVFVFTLGNSSEAFIILRAQDLGVSVFHTLLLLVLFNVVYALLSLPAGVASDRLGRRGLVAAGWAFFALLYLGLALVTSPWMLVPLFVLYGVYFGLTEGVVKAFVADVAPAGRRGTAYGLYNGLTGITLLPASLIAGFLWQRFSPAAPFFFSAVTALVAVACLLLLLPTSPPGSSP